MSMMVKIALCALSCAAALLFRLHGQNDAPMQQAMAETSETQSEDKLDEMLGRLKFVELPGILEVFAQQELMALPASGNVTIGADDGEALCIAVSGDQYVYARLEGTVKETGASAVKLEGGKEVCPQIRAITAAGIPVVAHIGMTPQSVNAFGGFTVQGKGEANARRVLEDALAVQEAGAFAVTLECVPPKLSALITKKLDIITIGIGASPECDAQVLVWQDMLGISDFKPKFAKHFAEVGETMREAFRAYDGEVKSGVFPASEHTFVKSDCTEEFLASLDVEY